VADVPLDPAFAAFGVAATVTPPGGAAIETKGFWITPLQEDMPVGYEFSRREPRRILVLPRPAVGVLPKGSAIAAAEYGGSTVRQWKVDGIDQMDADHVRAIVVLS
jgi:hypothetical protein